MGMDRSGTGSAGTGSAGSSHTEWPADVQPRWLDARELEEWMAMARVLTSLPARLERDLQHHANLNWMEYHALAMLSEHEGHTMRMTRLAAVTNASLSRLSHLVTRLEGRGELWDLAPDALCGLQLSPEYWDVLPGGYQPPG